MGRLYKYDLFAVILFYACLGQTLSFVQRNSYNQDATGGHTDLDTFLKKVLSAQDDLKWVDHLSKQMTANNAGNSVVSPEDRVELFKTSESRLQDHKLTSEDNVITSMHVAGNTNNEQHNKGQQPADIKELGNFANLDKIQASKDRREVVNDQGTKSSENKEDEEDSQDSVISIYWDNHGRTNLATPEEVKPRLLTEKKVDQEHQRLQLEDADGLLKSSPGSPLIGSIDNQMELNKQKPPFDILKPAGYPLMDIALHHNVNANEIQLVANNSNFGETSELSSSNAGYDKEETEILQKIEKFSALKPSNQDKRSDDKSLVQLYKVQTNGDELSDVDDDCPRLSDHSSSVERADHRHVGRDINPSKSHHSYSPNIRRNKSKRSHGNDESENSNSDYSQESELLDESSDYLSNERKKRRAVKRPGAVWQAEQDSDDIEEGEEAMNPEELEGDRGEKSENLNDIDEDKNSKKKTQSSQLQGDAERLKASYKSSNMKPSLSESSDDGESLNSERMKRFVNAEDNQIRNIAQDTVLNEQSRTNDNYTCKRKRRELERSKSYQIEASSRSKHNLVVDEYESAMPPRRSLLSVPENSFDSTDSDIENSPLSSSANANDNHLANLSENAALDETDLQDDIEAAIIEDKSPVLIRVKRTDPDYSDENNKEGSCEENEMETESDALENRNSKREVQESNHHNFIPMDIITTNDESEYEDILGASDFRHKQEDEDEEDYKTSDQHNDEDTRKESRSKQIQHTKHPRQTDGIHVWDKRDTRRVETKRTNKRHKKEDEDEEEYKSMDGVNGNKRRSLVVETDEKPLQIGSLQGILAAKEDQDPHVEEADDVIDTRETPHLIGDSVRDRINIKHDVIKPQQVAPEKSKSKSNDDKHGISEELNTHRTKDTRQAENPPQSVNNVVHSNHSISVRHNLDRKKHPRSESCDYSTPCSKSTRASTPCRCLSPTPSPKDVTFILSPPFDAKCLPKEPRHKGYHRNTCPCENEPEYKGDLDDGQIAMNIVNTIYQNVEKTPCFKDYIGPGLKCRYRPTVLRQSNDYHLRSEDMMHKIMALIDESVECEVRRRTCNHLPCDLKEFMNWLMRNETQPLPPSDPFLFRKLKNSCTEKPAEVTSPCSSCSPSAEDVSKRMATLDSLITSFDDMNDEAKSKTQRIYEYLLKQMEFLKSLSQWDNLITNHANSDSDVDNNFGNYFPMKRNQGGNIEEQEVDLIEQDLESLGLGNKSLNDKNLENKFNSDPVIEIESTQTDNKHYSILNSDDAEQDLDKDEISEKYKELLAEAAELRRIKRRENRKKRKIVAK